MPCISDGANMISFQKYKMFEGGQILFIVEFVFPSRDLQLIVLSLDERIPISSAVDWQLSEMSPRTLPL